MTIKLGELAMGTNSYAHFLSWNSFHFWEEGLRLRETSEKSMNVDGLLWRQKVWKSYSREGRTCQQILIKGCLPTETKQTHLTMPGWYFYGCIGHELAISKIISFIYLNICLFDFLNLHKHVEKKGIKCHYCFLIK